MKKVISFILSFVILALPMISSNCFALGNNTATNANSTEKTTTVTTKKCNKSRYAWIFKGLKGAVIAALTVAILAKVINELNLSDSIGRFLRLSYDYLVNSVGIIPSVAKDICSSFFRKNEISVFSDVSCPEKVGSFFAPKNAKCLNDIIAKLKQVYKNNYDLLGDDNLKYDLVFKRV